MEIEKILVDGQGWFYANKDGYNKIIIIFKDNIRQYCCYRNDKIVRIINGDFVIFTDYR
jgi:hypothetical protein